ARRPKVLFMCDQDSAYVMQETGVLAVGACEYGCYNESMDWVRQPFTTTSTSTTLSPMYNSVANATTTQKPNGTEEEETKSYTNFEVKPPHICYKGQCGQSQCLVPEERLQEIEKHESQCQPAVRCHVLDPYDEPDGVLADAECRLTSLGRGDVGRQLAFGTLGLAIFPPLAGLAVESMPENPFLVPNMPLSTPEWWWHTATGLLTMPMNAVRRYGAETAAVFAVVALLGTLCSGIDTYLPWTVLELNGTIPEVGLTLTIGALPAVPALWWAEALVDYIGHSNVFIMAFTFYGLRYTGLAFSTDYSWVAVSEALEVFTLSLVWVTAVLYFRHLVPRKYTTSGQALPVIAHFCIGRCIGAIVSGMVSLELPLESSRGVYRALGVLALLSAAVYLALYHLLLAPRCAAPACTECRINYFERLVITVSDNMYERFTTRAFIEQS
ncbi:Macrophage MHC class I receptor 2-like protein, partial [Operophtera brumata]